MDEIALHGYVTKLEHANSWVQLTLKRMLDLILSGAALLLLSPLIALIGMAVKVDTKGPVIYKHKRIGKDGRPFDLYKFRSMMVGGDDSGYIHYLEELIESSKNGAGKPYRKMDADPRVTRVGRLIRKYYLDELPQLWNILKGDMSLVGPRPHVQLEVEAYTPEQRRRLSVKPGATGLWQVQGKANCTFAELLDLDIQYVDSWSLALDLQLVWQTVLIMLGGGEGMWTRMNKSAPQKASQKYWLEKQAAPGQSAKVPSNEISREPILAGKRGK